MARTTSAGGKQSDGGDESAAARNDDTAPTAPRGTPPDLAALLAELDPDARVAVTRIGPTYAEGWLDDVRVPSGHEDELLETIRRNYGGGTFRIQLRRTRASGNRVFSAGTAVITIAGDPMLRGRRYLPDGTLEAPPTPTPAAAPAAPAPYLGTLASGSPMELLQAVAQLLEHRQRPATPGAPPPPQPLGDVAALIRALRPEVQPQQTDPFSSLDRTLTLLAKMRTVFPGAEERAPREDEEMFGGMEGKFLSMMMGAQGQRAAPPPGQWVWHPQQQQHVWMQTPAAAYYPPQAAPASPTPVPQAAPATAEGDDDEDEYEPYTVDDVLEGIRGLSPAEQMELLTRVGDVLPAEIGEAVQAQAGQLIAMKGGAHG